MRYCLTLILIAVMLAAGGCNWFAWIGYVFAPSPTKTVQPEFAGLEKKHVAVAVLAGPETQLDFALAQLEISEAVNIELKKRIKGITTVDARRVMRYQDEDPGWTEIPPERLCRKFNCDFLLLISLIEFSAREPGSAYLVRGRLTAEAKLYGRPKGPAPGCQWRSEEHFRVIHPPGDRPPTRTADAREIRFQTERLFAKALVRKFHKHKVPIEAD